MREIVKKASKYIKKLIEERVRYCISINTCVGELSKECSKYGEID